MNDMIRTGKRQSKYFKRICEIIESTPELTKAAKRERMTTNYLNELHLLYGCEQTAKDLGKDKEIGWFRSLERKVKRAIMNLDYLSSSSGSSCGSGSDDDSSSSDDDSSSSHDDSSSSGNNNGSTGSDGDKKLPAK